MSDELPKAPAANSAVAAVSPQQAEIRRDPNFASFYANHVAVESTAFDLKVVFGIVDARKPLNAAVDQMASVNMSWPEVKLLIYWMQVHLDGYERENGKIKIPANALPPDFPATLPPQLDTPQGREAIEKIRKARADFIAKLSEV